MSTAVLSLKEVFVAYGTHAIIPGAGVETTACGTEQRSLTLVGLLGHVPPGRREELWCTGQYRHRYTIGIKRHCVTWTGFHIYR